MKRDMDLIRAILLKAEEHEHGIVPKQFAIDGYSQEQVLFHCWLLCQTGLAEGSDISHFGSKSPAAILRRLTWQGYEFLDASRNQDNWNRATAAGKRLGGMGLEVLKSVLTAMATAAAKQQLGLP